MKPHIAARIAGLTLFASAITGAHAQNAPTDRTPAVTYGPGKLGAYRAGEVSGPDFRDSTRIQDLIKAGQLYLSLNDAIALALENNLDLEIQRFGVRMTSTDVIRAEGGGLLRGIPLTVNEAPAGVGGPGTTLNNSAASGTVPQTAI